jgi:hypothetical protein
MASNLSSIGFDFADAADFQAQMIACAAEASERVGCAAGDYSIWRSPTGAQIWFHIPTLGTEDDARDIVGLTPFFEGTSDIALEVVERIVRPDDNAFEGAFRAVVGGPDEGYPIVFDAVDFAAHAHLALPLRCRARMVGFARTLRAFAHEAAYTEAHSAHGGLALAPRAFVPVGQFTDGAAPTSEVLLTGRVAEHHALVNEATGKGFHWLVVESLGASFDIVADMDTPEGDLVVGGNVEV